MSFDDEGPYPEFETEWVKPEPEPCPDCECCSARLCARAAMAGTSCALQAAAGDQRTVADCPCSAGRKP